MALSGPQALQHLDDAIRDVRREENDISSKLSKSAEIITKLHENETELFRQLARLRLSPEMLERVTGNLSAAEKAARGMVAQHQKALDDAGARVGELDKQVAQFALDRRDALAEVEKQQKALSDLSGQIAAAINADADYKDKRSKADELHTIADESLKKTQQAEEDREVKGKPYRDDKLFMYLWEAGYGTRNYKANNLVRWLDSMVARLVDYQNTRPNYAMLNEISLRLREHAERQIAAAEAADKELDEVEARAIDKAGGGPIRKALEEAQAKVAEIDDDMVKSEDERDKLTRELTDMTEQDNPALATAITGLAGSLQATDMAQLLADARATATPEDDAILKKIDDVRLRIVDEENDNRDKHERLKVLASRRRELEDIEFEFKKKRFDDPRSSFREDNLVGDLLGEFLKGAITASTYWGHWQQSQNWRAGTSNWGGGIGLPNSGRNTNWPTINFGGGSSSPNWGSFTSNRGGGGFSRPRTGSRGTRKSGGFKTGGGF